LTFSFDLFVSGKLLRGTVTLLPQIQSFSCWYINLSSYFYNRWSTVYERLWCDLRPKVSVRLSPYDSTL